MTPTRLAVVTQQIALLKEAKTQIKGVWDEEQDAFDALPEEETNSEEGKRLDENRCNLDDAYSALEDAINSLKDIK